MRIKDIRKYRTFYKNIIREVHGPSRNEHYSGQRRSVNGSNEFGWFELYHGDNDTVKGNLKSFLEMADDGQAVYEFLQNAVDAKATHFTMIWGTDPIDGQDYLLVANNGDMFTLASVRSILNIGSSTKANDDKTIGQYGIGFKLAHRLVGRGNGLDELLNHNYGPVLFSWKNKDFENLHASKNFTLVSPNIEKNGDKYHSKGSEPWLFKILLTCFPVLPQNDNSSDEVILISEEKTDKAFSKEELTVMQRWVSQNKDVFYLNEYNEGSLFFIKLGDGKRSQLGNKGLLEGIRFSLAILNELSDQQSALKTIQFNRDEPLTKPDLQFASLTIFKDDPEFCDIIFGKAKQNLDESELTQFDESQDISVLFGFNRYDERNEIFRSIPNIYLFFPLTEEVHKWNYILHSNAFNKKSARTSLQEESTQRPKQNGRLFAAILTRLKSKFTIWIESKSDAFLHLYAAMLSSSKSDNTDRTWINKFYTTPIDNLLLDYIPFQDDGSYSIIAGIIEIRILQTAIDIDLNHPNWSGIRWFFYEDQELLRKAKSKLKLKDFTVADILLVEGSHELINKWLNNDSSRSEVLINELNAYLINSGTKFNETQRDNYLKLKFIEFIDGQFYSQEDLDVGSNSDRLLIYGNLEAIRLHLIKIGVIVSKVNFEKYLGITRLKYLGNDFQLNNNFVAIGIVNDNYKEELLKRMGLTERLEILEVLTNRLTDGKHKKGGYLKLFRNRQGKYTPLRNILSSSIEDSLLNRFKISDADSNDILQKYTCNNQSEIYENIVYYHWFTLLEKSSQYQSKKDFFDKISTYINPEDKKHLSEHNIVLLDDNIFQISTDDKLFFKKGLYGIKSKKFQNAQRILKNSLSLLLPDQSQMPFLEERPWNFRSIEISITDHEFNFNDLLVLIELDKYGKLNLFSNTWINKTETDLFEIVELDSNESFYEIENIDLRKFIANNLSQQVKVIPEKLLGYNIKNIGNSSEFIKEIAIRFNGILDMEQYKSFIPLLHSFSIDDQKIFFDKLSFIYLYWGENFELNIGQLEFIKRLLKSGIDQEVISSKLRVDGFEAEIRLHDVADVIDAINVKINNQDIKLSKAKILLEEGQDQLNNLTSLLNKLIVEDILSETKLRSLLKLDHRIEPREIVDAFNTVLSNNDDHIQNTDQLLFLASNCHNGSNSIYDILLFTKDESSSDLIECHFLPSAELEQYISDEYILHNRYADLDLRLLTKYDTFQIKIVDEEAVEEGIVTIARNLSPSTPLKGDMLNDEISIVQVMDLIVELSNQKTDITWEWDFESIFRRFAVSPREYSINPSAHNERLPIELQNYSNNILKLIGVDYYRKSVNILYSYLTDESTTPPYSDKINEIPQKLLINVLSRIANNEALILFDLDRTRFDVLIEVFNNLLDNGALLSTIGFLPCHISNATVVLKSLSDLQYKLDVKEWQFIRNTTHSPTVFDNLKIIPEVLSSSFANLGNKVQELSITKTFVDNSAIELSDDRYQEWKEDTNVISIFNIHGEPQFELEYKASNVVLFNESISSGYFHIESLMYDEYALFYDNSLISPRHVIDNCNNYEIREALKDYLEVHKDQMADFAEFLLSKNNREVSDEEYKDILEKREEHKRLIERKSLVDSLGKIEKYSYRWFEDYIQTLINYDSSDRSQTQQTIKFDKITTVLTNGNVNRRYAQLRGPSKVISQRIQDFQDIKLLLKFNNGKSVDIKLENTSKKGQSLICYYPQGFQNLIKDFPKLVQAKLRFTPIIDLRERLLKAFKYELQGLNWNQIQSILPSLHYIYGPPGTGKTYSLCNLIRDKVKSNPTTKFLMVGPTNKAADVLIKRLWTDFGVRDLLRISTPSDPELNELDDAIYRLDLVESDLLNSVVATTVQRLPYFEIKEVALFAQEDHWDYLIIDEASMISIEYIVFAILSLKKYNPTCKVIIAGDPMQIPPVVNVSDDELEVLEIEELNIYRMMNISKIRSAKSNVRDLDTIDLLTKQYRSILPIGNLYSQYGYEGILSTDRMTERGFDFPSKYSLLNSPITFIDIPLERGENVIKVDKLNKSPYHLYSALLVVELLRDIGRTISEDLNVGIITPYKSQAVIVERLVTSADINPLISVTCDTVHGFQGDEKKLIIFIANPNNFYYTGHAKALLSKEYIYNVAISRAEDKLWILHPYEAFKREPSSNLHIDNLYNIEFARAKGIKYVSSPDLEKILFDDENYILENSYVTSHDSVNVYGLVDMGYYIKVGYNAVDIQIQGGRSIYKQE